ncbi:MAG TPA: class I SAM-dependent methyltransferase [Accumulibacter sp.]|nr:class I SAM-dependent methyltransferase [Accumulibacter sp.]
MRNPWLEIPLSDYESHISLPAVAQGEMFASQLAATVQQFSPESVAIIGCAGGNGLDRLPVTVRRVVGVDINPDYIAATSSRYRRQRPGLELHVADIQLGPLPFAPVDLIYAALVFEYVSLPATLDNLARVCSPGGRLIVVLQQPSVHVHAVTPSPYASIRKLVPVMNLVSPAEMCRNAATVGFALETENRLTLASGKEFAVQTYRHSSSASE